ncbi:TIGR03089 family protein [Timonella sp. A28]|uniref:TIGR03089 family protein n=1 Tax=Timonella sp. A28 TaxID=3442640 RepID=UPI003EC0A444
MNNPAAFVATTLNGLLNNPGNPRLTWYGDDYERIELSGSVLNNWVNKTTNLLVEECDAASGSTIGLHLPPHWRQLIWSLAALRTGATLLLDPSAPCDVRVTSHSDDASLQHDELIMVTLQALARTYDGLLPSGALDAAAVVMTYGDSLGYVPATELHSQALASEHHTLTYQELPAWVETTPLDTEQRVLIKCSDDSPLTALNVLRTALHVWAGGGSVVLVSAATTRELTEDPARTQRIVDSERVTVTYRAHSED